MAEGKKPDAAELSKVIHDSMCDRAGCEIEPKEHLAEIAQQLADFQRQTLLAARAAFHPTDRYRGTDVLDKLEHLASKP